MREACDSLVGFPILALLAGCVLPAYEGSSSEGGEGPDTAVASGSSLTTSAGAGTSSTSSTSSASSSGGSGAGGSGGGSPTCPADDLSIALGTGIDGHTLATEAAILADGRLAVAGIYRGSLELVEGSPLPPTDASHPLAFLAIYDGSSAVWSQAIGPGLAEVAEHHVFGLAATDDGGFVVGVNLQNATVDVLGREIVAEHIDSVLLEVGGDGELVWSRSVTGPSAQFGQDVAVGPDGSILWLGEYDAYPARVVDAFALPTTQSDEAMFVLRLDAAGEVEPPRARPMEAAAVQPSRLAFTSEGHVVVAGSYSGSASFDGATLPLVSAHTDGFALELDADLEVTRAVSFGSTSREERIDRLVADASGITFFGTSYGLSSGNFLFGGEPTGHSTFASTTEVYGLHAPAIGDGLDWMQVTATDEEFNADAKTRLRAASAERDDAHVTFGLSGAMEDDSGIGVTATVPSDPPASFGIPPSGTLFFELDATSHDTATGYALVDGQFNQLRFARTRCGTLLFGRFIGDLGFDDPTMTSPGPYTAGALLFRADPIAFASL